MADIQQSTGPCNACFIAHQRNGIESARSFPVREARSELLRRAREPLSCDVVNHLREMVKREREATEQLRLDRWHHGKG